MGQQRLFLDLHARRTGGGEMTLHNRMKRDHETEIDFRSECKKKTFPRSEWESLVERVKQQREENLRSIRGQMWVPDPDEYDQKLRWQPGE